MVTLTVLTWPCKDAENWGGSFPVLFFTFLLLLFYVCRTVRYRLYPVFCWRRTWEEKCLSKIAAGSPSCWAAGNRSHNKEGRVMVVRFLPSSVPQSTKGYLDNLPSCSLLTASLHSPACIQCSRPRCGLAVQCCNWLEFLNFDRFW